MIENSSRVNSIAALANVGIITHAITRTKERPSHLPGLVVVHGNSGYGKTYAASYAAANLGAIYVAAKSTWTKKTYLESILKEIGIPPARTIGEMMEQVCQQLAISNKPLIVDEFDYCVDRNGLLAVTRDIYDGSLAPIILIGEELLPAKLEKEERFHNRILEWVAAQPASFEDAKKLRQLFCSDVTISDDLLEKIVSVSDGRVRRICVNLERVRDYTLSQGKEEITLKDWGKNEFYNCSAPARRR